LELFQISKLFQIPKEAGGNFQILALFQFKTKFWEFPLFHFGFSNLKLKYQPVSFFGDSTVLTGILDGDIIKGGGSVQTL
jgi:hypothetical protein